MKAAKIYRILSVFLLVQIAAIQLLSRAPDLVEQYYSNGIFPYISTIFRGVLGWIPFSFGDFFYIAIGSYLIHGVYDLIKNRFKNLKERFLKFFAMISILFFFFHFLWGLNYQRNSLFKTLALEQEEYSTDQLVALSEDLIAKLKINQAKLVTDDSIKVSIDKDKASILSEVGAGYAALNKDYPHLKYQPKSIKKSLFALPLTYMGFAGYLNPFTLEAQVDHLVPKHNLPMIASHEVAHQLGYASESEANFIGYLAASQHPEAYYQYSANLMAMRYAVAATYGKDSIRGQALIDNLPKGVIKNIRESQEFWSSYQNKAEPFFKLFYDNYLKANQQQDGIKGYSKMVGLLVAYREKNGL